MVESTTDPVLRKQSADTLHPDRKLEALLHEELAKGKEGKALKVVKLIL